MRHVPARASIAVASLALLACSPSVDAATDHAAPAALIQAGDTGACGFASAEFCWVNPLPQGSSLTGAWLASGDEGWLVGPGAILHWSGGALDAATVPGAAALRSVWGSAADDVWAAGEVLLHNGGRTWSVVTDAPPGPWNAVHGTSRSDVWLVGVGGAAAHFDGVRWSRIPSPSGDELVAVSARQSGEVLAATATGGTVYRWDGATWSIAARVALRRTAALLAVGDEVWIGGEASPTNAAAGLRGAALFHAVAGGPWEPVTVTGLETGAVTSMTVSPAGVVWLGGVDGAGGGLAARRTTSAWIAEALPAPALPPRSAAAGDDAVLFVGDGGQVFVRRGVTASWVAVHHGVPGYLQGATTAGGEPWFAATVPTTSRPQSALLRVSQGSAFTVPLGVSDVVYGIWANGPNDIWAGTLRNGFLHFDGQNWTARVGGYAGLVDGVWSSGPSDVWGMAGSYAVHLDGTSVVQHPLPVTGVRRAFGTSPRDVWAVGPSGTVLRWDGSSWSTLPIPGGPMMGVWGTAANDVWFVGYAGLALHWDGASLKTVPTGTQATLWAVAGSSASDVWAVGSGGTVLHFDGRSWAPVASGTRNALTAVTLTSRDVYVAGEFGTILRRSR